MAAESENSSDRRSHWDTVYQGSEPEARSWYQSEFSVPLSLFATLGVSTSSAVLDVGGGETKFVDLLIAKGFSDVTVLDISEVALRTSKGRMAREHGVAWVNEDILAWQPKRRYDVWHDRAVFHFLSGRDVDFYREQLLRSLNANGTVVLATFALEGPEYCSGLAVTRYGCEEIEAFLGEEFDVVECKKELHTMPNSSIQPFTWVAAKRRHNPSLS
ncbi:MAG TPA: class I SAM-dependent methyltransferase [Acidimicrobiales bacterium]